MQSWVPITDEEIVAQIRAVPIHYGPTNYYGVSGSTTNWSDVSMWAKSSGGSGNNGPPTSSDTATLDGNSVGVTVDSTADTCSSLSLTSAYTNTLTLAANFSPGSISIAGGSLHAGGYNITAASLTVSGSTACTLSLGTGTLTLTGNSGTVWNVNNPGLMLSAVASTIVLSASSGTMTFAGLGQTYGSLTLSGAGSTVTFTGSNNFGTFTSGQNNLTFSAAQTATAFNLAGCKSLTGNLVQTAGTVSAPAGCTITNSTASGGALFIAPKSCDGGGNSGWTFISSSGMLLTGVGS